MKIMLGYNPNLDSKDKLGNTGLHLATRKNHHQIVLLMLDAGSNPNIRNNAGNTVLDIAVSKKNSTLAAMLRNRHALQTLSQPNGQSTAELLAKNTERQSLIANKTENPFNNWPALNLAAWRGQLEHVQSLLSMSGKDKPVVDSADEEHHTPLSRASWQGYTDIVDILVVAGAELEHRLPNGQTPLYLAVRGGHFDTVKLLLKLGAEFSEGIDGVEPIFILAAREKYEAIALALIKSGANIKSDFKGKTALMWAAKHGLDDLLKRLVEVGSDPNGTYLSTRY